jgi:hypothetical protein
MQLQDKLLATVLDVLKPGGKFLTFAYLQGLLLPSGSMFRKKLHAKFKKVKTTGTVWLNIAGWGIDALLIKEKTTKQEGQVVDRRCQAL